MKFMKLRRIRHIFMGMLLMTTVLGAALFSSMTLFAEDEFVRAYQFSIFRVLL